MHWAEPCGPWTSCYVLACPVFPQCLLCLCQVLGDIKHCILATDLALFFGNRAKLKDMVECKTFDWKTKDHRYDRISPSWLSLSQQYGIVSVACGSASYI